MLIKNRCGFRASNNPPRSTYNIKRNLSIWVNLPWFMTGNCATRPFTKTRWKFNRCHQKFMRMWLVWQQHLYPRKREEKFCLGSFANWVTNVFDIFSRLFYLSHLSTRLKACEVSLKFASLLKFDYSEYYQLILTRHNTRTQRFCWKAAGLFSRSFQCVIL